MLDNESKDSVFITTARVRRAFRSLSFVCALSFVCLACNNSPKNSGGISIDQTATNSTDQKKNSTPTSWVGVNSDSLFLKLGDSLIEVVGGKTVYGKFNIQRQGRIIVIEQNDTVYVRSESFDTLVLESVNSKLLVSLVGKVVFRRIEDFSAFISRFSTDKNFQKSRILFPLKVVLDSAQSITCWTSQEWDLKNTFLGTIPSDDCIETNGFGNLSPAADILMWHDCDTDLLTGYKFKRTGREWFLIGVREHRFSG